MLYFSYCRCDQGGCFVGCRISLMNPAHLLPNIRMIIQIRVHSCSLYGASESQFMQRGRAGGYDNPVHNPVFYILHDKFLTRVGTCKHIRARHSHSGNLFHIFSNLFHIHMIGYITAAVADVNTDFFSCFGCHYTISPDLKPDL